MKLRKLELLPIGLFLFTIILLRIDEENFNDYKVVIGLAFFLFFSIGGYYIFNPNEDIKLGKVISVFNGILLGVIYFYILVIINHATFNYRFIFSIYSALFGLSLILFLILFFVNKKHSQNKLYIKFVAIRNIFPLLFLFILLIIPNKIRVLIFYDSSSNKYYELLQRELIEKAYGENDEGKTENAINSSLLSVKYSKIRNDTVSNVYISSITCLGYSYYMNGNYDKADSLLNKAVVLCNIGEFDLSTLYNQAIYYLALNSGNNGYYRKSDSLLYKSLKVYNDKIRNAIIYKRLANNANENGRYHKADSLYKLALINHKASEFENYSNYIFTLNEMGIINQFIKY